MTVASASPPETLADWACLILMTADPAAKAALTAQAMAAWHAGPRRRVGTAAPPDRPARPDRPDLRLPRDMPRRRTAQSLAGRTALLHALAHIELNAVDMYWDIIARFSGPAADRLGLSRPFFDDILSVAADEARHFTLLSRRLAALGSHYGALPAHDGLWQASMDTAHDLGARLAIVPMVLEARGLDVTPQMIAGLRAAGDADSAAIVQIIHDDEIRHVSVGRAWFEHLCAARGVPPVETWQDLVRAHFKGALKRPFNRIARDKAGFHTAFYEPLAPL